MSLLMMLVLVVAAADLVFTVKAWRLQMEHEKALSVPTGRTKRMRRPERPLKVDDEMDMDVITKMAQRFAEDYAEEIGEEVEVTEDDVRAAMKVLDKRRSDD